MNRLLLFHCAAILWLMALSGPAIHAAESTETNAPESRYVVGLSPFLPKEVKDDVYRRIVGFALEDLPLGSSLSLYDAYRLQTITRIAIPENRAFRSGKTRANQFKDQIQKLRQFLADETVPSKTNGMDLSQAIRLPQFMDFVSANLKSETAPLRGVILGSPLYLDPKEPGFSMVDGYFPSDGHLKVGKDRSVFGLKERTSNLDQIRVYWGFFGDPWVSDVHREKVGRFWSLFLNGQGGQLAAFHGDLPTLFEAALERTPVNDERNPFRLDPGQSKVEMLRIRRETHPEDWITQDQVPNAARRPPSERIGPLKIGIRWRGDLDLDLYATPRTGAETLYFERKRSADGFYFKDHRTSPDREYEYIEFERPVDVWQLDARVNFYKGQAPDGAEGEVRIEFGGQVYSGRFSLRASHGNEGRTGPNQGDFWARLDIPGILLLREAHARGQ